MVKRTTRIATGFMNVSVILPSVPRSLLRSDFCDVCVVPRYIKPRSAKRLFAVMPRCGSSAIDEVDSLLRGGKQRVQIFTYGQRLLIALHLSEHGCCLIFGNEAISVAVQSIEILVVPLLS